VGCLGDLFCVSWTPPRARAGRKKGGIRLHSSREYSSLFLGDRCPCYSAANALRDLIDQKLQLAVAKAVDGQPAGEDAAASGRVGRDRARKDVILCGTRLALRSWPGIDYGQACVVD
jgi:hypothetical protein